jgi:putative membrane protein
MNLIVSVINQIFILTSAISIAFGWRAIRKQQVTTHKRLMTLGGVLAALFFVSYVLKTILIGDTSFGGPQSAKVPYQIFLQTHSILATVGGILGLISLYTGYKARYGTHKRLGPWTSVTWFITAASGLAVFLLLYVIYSPGPTTNVFRAWMGQ